MSRALKSEQKEKKFYNGSWKVFTSRIANWILENLDVSRVYSYERNFDGKPSSIIVACPLRGIVYDQME